jgi:hypothetical protein
LIRAAGHFISIPGHARLHHRVGRQVLYAADLHARVHAQLGARLQEQRSAQVHSGREDNRAGAGLRGGVNGLLNSRRIDRLPVSFGSVITGAKLGRMGGP